MKSKPVAYLIWLCFGWIGLHRMYCGKWLTGLLWMFTGGLFGIGWFFDLFLTSGMVDMYNALHQERTVNQHVNVQVAQPGRLDCAILVPTSIIMTNGVPTTAPVLSGEVQHGSVCGPSRIARMDSARSARTLAPSPRGYVL